jgi:hypothetical protein
MLFRIFGNHSLRADLCGMEGIGTDLTVWARPYRERDGAR